MKYKCDACGHVTRRASEMGTCPACSSTQLKAVRNNKIIQRDKPKKTAIEIVIMVLLWALLGYGVYDKFL